MKLGILFSGGKDSNYATYLMSKNNFDIKSLISMISKNPESYMFQTPGNNFIKYQSNCLNIPLLEYKTKGKKEEELKDLKLAIQKSIKNYQIDAIVSGAIKSIYQASRIQKICADLNIWCFNPLWQIDEKTFLKQLIEEKFVIIIIGIFSYPFTSKYLGKILTTNLYDELVELENKYQINPAGEGGELETFVIDAPNFNKKIKILESKKNMDSENSGILNIQKFKLINKTQIKTIDVETNTLYNNLNLINIKKSLNTNNSTNNLILIISSCKYKIHENEFIRPITNILLKLNKQYEIIHYLDLPKFDKIKLENYSKIIISGTALKDNDYLEYLFNFKVLNKINTPILGICAGYQILGLINGCKLIKNQEIGFTETRIIKKSYFFEIGDYKTYSLHNNSLKLNSNFEIFAITKNSEQIIKLKNKEIYGFLFHLEITNIQLLINFIK